MSGEPKQDGQDSQDKEEMMKDECRNDEYEAASLSFFIYPSSFSIAFILTISVHPVNCFSL
jgi:hypothetical protein